MSRGRVVVMAVGLVLAGIGVLIWGRTTAGEVRRPAGADEDFLAFAYSRAAEASFGRRVLVLHAHPLDPARGEILDAAQAAGGWALFGDLPAAAQRATAALADLSQDAADDWDTGRLLSEATVTRLAHLGVALVLIEDGQRVVVADDAVLAVPGLSAEPRVPALRVRSAEIVYRPAVGGMLEPVPILDPSDLLFGGRVTLDVTAPGEHVFVWPAGGARVTVNGAQVQGRADDLGRLVLDLPVGRATVRATYEGGSSRGLLLTAGVAAIVVGLLVLMRTFRPRMEHDGGGGPHGAVA